ARAAADADSDAGWASLFDGRTLGDWQPVGSLGSKATVQDGSIVLDSLPGWNAAHWRTDVPRENYEFAYETMRKSGSGDFGTLAFAIGGATHCMLHIGAGDGRTIGLSLVDNRDYRSNGTARKLDLCNGRWYSVQLQVTEDRVRAWIDGRQVVDQPREGHRFAPKSHISRRIKAFGLCSLKSVAAVRNIRLRRLKAGQVAEAPAPPPPVGESFDTPEAPSPPSKPAGAGALYIKGAGTLHPLWQSRLYDVALTQAKKLAAQGEYAGDPAAAKAIVADAEALAAFWQAARAGAAKLKAGQAIRVKGMLGKVDRVAGDTIYVKAGSATLAARLAEFSDADLIGLARQAQPLADARGLLALALLELHAKKPAFDKAQEALALASGAGVDVALRNELLAGMAAEAVAKRAAKPKPRKMTAWGHPFDGKSLRGWQPNNPSWWSVKKDGEIAVHVENHDATLLYNRMLYDDFVLDLEAKNLGVGPRFGVIFRKKGDNYISFCLNDQFDAVGCKAGDNLWRASLTGVTLKSSLPETLSIDTGRWYRLRVICEGERFRCWVNERLIYEGTDTVLRRGHIGLGARRADARFRRIRIRRILPAEDEKSGK
ncbi:DUF1080 domain-containing protein, partial [bacterium]|nr:DUF1080 domain-containing protein [bacterium]